MFDNFVLGEFRLHRKCAIASNGRCIELMLLQRFQQCSIGLRISELETSSDELEPSLTGYTVLTPNLPVHNCGRLR